MNQVDYKKKYNEALERMKSWARGEHPECFSEARKALEFVFQDAKQIDEEETRNGLLCFLDELYIFGSNINLDKWDKSHYAKWIELVKSHKTPEWTDEDDFNLNGVYTFIMKNRKGDTDEIYHQERNAEWLKSLKERFTLNK